MNNFFHLADSVENKGASIVLGILGGWFILTFIIEPICDILRERKAKK